MFVRVCFWSALLCVASAIPSTTTTSTQPPSATTATTPGNEDWREQLRVLSKQVTTLMERRRDDLQSIEEHMRRKLSKSQELGDVREEIRSLRLEIEQLRTGGVHKVHHMHPMEEHTSGSTQEHNDHVTLKWLSNVLHEVRTEIAEMQATLNSTAILTHRERFDSAIGLLRTDVYSLGKELEVARAGGAKLETQLLEMRDELSASREHSQAASILCAKTKSQLKSSQIEWSNNWKRLQSRSAPAMAEGHSGRHQRVLKMHIVELEKKTRGLISRNAVLEKKIDEMQAQINSLHQQQAEDKAMVNSSNDLDELVYDRINGNDVENYLREQQQPGVQMLDVERQQSANTKAIANLTDQFTNFDKLHSSMLELLENVESIEDRVDKMMPEFRKEISMLEFQSADGSTQMAAIKEDQANLRASVKAISVSVSNLQDRADSEGKKLKAALADIDNLKKSTTVQSSKLHDHILKSESSTADVNATKSTIHLVQELKSFENEYKSIVNKLPHDCSGVSGPNGVYLISPGDGEPILAYCSEGWTTIQKRYDGSVEFNRNWNDYSNGFGSPAGEHWLGNRNLHALTRANCTRLEVSMKDIYGKYWRATYDEFHVADFGGGFRLHVAGYAGNASDALDYQNRMEFSTVDNDRDISNTHCASNYEGGWWFSHCQHANLNGRYNLGLTWFDSSRNEWIAVATSEMRLRRRDLC